jgi:DNA primase
MSDLQDIKKKILDENRVDRILEAIGCEHISYSGGRVEAQLPERFYSANKRSVQVKLNDYLTSNIRNKADFRGGDIYNLVSYIHHDIRGGEEDFKSDLHNAKRFICETLGWTEYLKGGIFKTKKDYVAPLRALVKESHRSKEIKPNPVLPEEILDEFLPYPSYDWMKEGLSYKTQKMYGIGFDLESKRITIPMRNRFGKLVGVKGRIMKDEDDERKYLYLYRYQNRLEWFNFHYAHPYILMDKRVYILESEKSSMKLFEHGVYNSLAIGASEISIEQSNIVKQLGLDIEIVLCYDKGISLDEIRRNAELFKGRKVFAMYDVDNLLENKDAPIDKGIEIWNKMVEKYVFEIE